MSWFGNKTGARTPEVVKAGRVARSVLTQLVVGGVQKRRISKALPHHAYQHLFREKVTPIIDAEWRAMRAANDKLDSSQQLAFRNRRLQEMLTKESQGVRDRVEAFRIEDLKRRLEEGGTDDEDENSEVCVPDAHLISPEEASRRKIGLSRQR